MLRDGVGNQGNPENTRGMWALAVVAWAAAVYVWHWRRSGQTFFDYTCLAVAWGYAHLWHRWSARGAVAFPSRGPFLVVSNHTCSPDPLFLLAASPRNLGFVMAR